MNKKNRILIFGSTGMLGSMVVNYFLKQSYTVACTYRSEPISEIVAESIDNEYCFDANSPKCEHEIQSIIEDFRPDYIINCIGLIKPYCNSTDSKSITHAINVNSLFPHRLSAVSERILPETNILLIATDCVYNGITGFYDEDAAHNPEDIYGKTKSLGEVIAMNVLNIRCSIIGPELKHNYSLLEWIKSDHPKKIVNGYLHHLWNGITTLQYAEYCHKIIQQEKYSYLKSLGNCLHYTINTTVTKYDLIKQVKEIYALDFNVNPVVEPKPGINRAIISNKIHYELLEMKSAIKQLKEYTDECGWYK